MPTQTLEPFRKNANAAAIAGDRFLTVEQNPQRALHCYEEALFYQQQILAQEGPTAMRLGTITLALISVAEVLRHHLSQGKRALQFYAAACQVHYQLIHQYGETAERNAELTKTLEALAQLYLEREEMTAAIDTYQQALTLHQVTLKEFGPTVSRIKALTIAVDRIAQVYHRVGRFACSQKLREEHLALCRQYIKVMGPTDDLLHSLSKAVEGLAQHHFDLDNIRQSQQVCAEHLAECRKLFVNENPSVALLETLAEALVNCGDVADQPHRSLFGEEKGGLQDFYGEALELRRKLLVENEQTAPRLSALAELLEKMADVEEAAPFPLLGGTKNVAVADWYEEALLLRRQIIAKYGPSKERSADVKLLLEKIAGALRTTKTADAKGTTSNRRYLKRRAVRGFVLLQTILGSFKYLTATLFLSGPFLLVPLYCRCSPR